jgi:hypothetical protein
MIVPDIKEREQKIVGYINDYRTTLSDARSDREDTWLECMEAYLSKFNKAWVAQARSQNRSRRYLALTWDAVENNHSQLMEMIFPNRNWFFAEPRVVGGATELDDTAAPKIRELMKWQHEMSSYHEEASELVKWLVILGNACWTTDWHTQRMVDYPVYAQAMAAWEQEQKLAWAEYQQLMQEYQLQAQQALEAGLPPPPPPPVEMPEQPVGDPKIAYEGPRLRVGNIFNFLIDTEANDPRTAFRVTTFYRSKAYLKRYTEADETGYRVYENLENVQDSDRRTEEDSDRDITVSDTFGVEIPQKGAVKLYECCGDFEVLLGDGTAESKIFRNYIATIANEKTLIRFEPSYLWDPEPHQKLARLIPCPGQTYGIGLVENALGTQDAINARQNQLIDAAAVAINPEFKAINDGIFDPIESRSGPGAIHMVGNMDNLQPVLRDFKGLQLSFSEIGTMKGEFQQLTRSANPFTTQHYKKSATEIARDASVSGSSLKRIAMYVENNAIIPTLNMQLQLNKQYMKKDVVLRVTQGQEDNIWTVSPADVRHAWNIRVIGSQNAMLKEKRVEDLLMFFQLTTGNPATLPYIDVRYLLERLLEELGVQDADKILANDALAQLQAAILQSQQTGGANAEGERSESGRGVGAGNSAGAGAPAATGVSPVQAGVAPFVAHTPLAGVAT